MKLELFRKWFTDKSTIGKLYINDLYECYTLEDKYRDLAVEQKVIGETAIPHGKYKVIVDWSNRFKKFMPKILNVPGFEGIRIHAGNTAQDTEGCIIVGLMKSENRVSKSTVIANQICEKIKMALKAGGEVTIEIMGDIEEQGRSL